MSSSITTAPATITSARSALSPRTRRRWRTVSGSSRARSSAISSRRRRSQCGEAPFRASLFRKTRPRARRLPSRPISASPAWARGEHAEQSIARLAAKRLDLAGSGRVMSQESQGRAHGAERHAGDPRDSPAAHARELKAAAAQVDDRAAVQRPPPQNRRGAQPRFFRATQDPDLHAFVASQRGEQSIGVRRVSDRRGRHREDTRRAALPHLGQKTADGLQGLLDSRAREQAATVAGEPGLDAFLTQDAKIDARSDRGENQPDSVRAEVEHREPLRHGRSIESGHRSVKLRDRYGPQPRSLLEASRAATL